ncbi:MAG: hypothetical protein HC886_04370 [Leptolyngbyaceae cyanobacterium SM1_1_3]|nr:hypothetical protein [Leptolyngbyaceae cyanobacterium SM1_1_3]NJN02184.1 hypothetical protein [Leptolyngbyaceae cyanobacterium RM1_1_2]NJO11683.1 hypothetical protein [Leptolyngbyaceae cyanobacterium SL_1_1]
MQVSNTEWSLAEKKVAQEVLKIAYEREVKALIATVRESAGSITALEQIWQLHDLLSSKRYEIDGKYDDRESALIFVFAQLVKEGWLYMDELASLEGAKRAKVAALTHM